MHEKYGQTVLYPAEWLLHFRGFQTYHEGMLLGIVGYRGVMMHFTCLGLNIMGAFAALMLAFPDKVNKLRKAVFMLSVLLLIHVLNILRVFTLAVQDYYKFNLYFEHHDLFNSIVYLIVLIVFYQWISWASRYDISLSSQDKTYSR